MAFGAVLGQRVDAYRKNETYSQQQANDRFALALKTDTGEGTSFDIYPDEGSNIVMTAYGYTEQEGSGDPSPENVRPIRVGGQRLKKVVVSGDETSSSENNFSLPTLVRDLGTAYNFGNILKYVSPASGSRDAPCCLGAWAKNGVMVSAVDGSASENKAWVKAQYESGNPFIFYYEPANSEDADGLYSMVVMNNENRNVYASAALPLTEPLCNGDYVVSNQDGQCVEVHSYFLKEFDGSEGWYFFNPSSGDKYMVVPHGVTGAAINSLSLCSHGKYFPSGVDRLTSNQTNLTVGIEGKFAFLFEGVSVNEYANVWKNYISQEKEKGTPFQVVFKLSSPLTYTHAPVPIIAKPDSTGKVTVSGEKQVSAVYNKSISKAIQELQSAVTALSSGGGQQ